MNTSVRLTRLSVCGLALIIVACDSRGPTAPSFFVNDRAPGPSVDDRVPRSTTFTVVNGWTQQPVANAVVTTNGTVVTTDAVGQFSVVTDGRCITVEVQATGFLERRTCALAQISLWPIADPQEREATRTAVFSRDQLQTGWAFPIEVAFDPLLTSRDDVRQTWMEAGHEIAQLSLRRIQFQFVERVSATADGGAIVTPAAIPAVCSTSPAWPIEVSGFCVEFTSVYFVDKINVPPALLVDRGVALRALLSWVGGARPHPLPGLLNKLHPAPELSEFERKTLHMAGLRTRRVVWPDFDD